ncbi:carboxypeptidase regulatory-like domain-containing protein [Nocardiopsis sp. MG754419]|uniref:carboxypeptidase regulatory-like domain-containing protein n=1 Tax=Nocardiopsis sp. MG754419 TaxID=2259865 RepID=UPI001BA87BD9|nr:carboxypeptidase regulatory-like domain-containing protein [Nocardiopsis sp. MG754419]MBR8740347.1 carboxypeptidase regulatory-like domain-containing protein [Nocardiopsis sp. MG754419]
MKDTEPGRRAALAAFDRSLDRARPVRTVLDTAPPAAASRDGGDGATTTLCLHLDDLVIDLHLCAREDGSSLAGLVRGEFDHVEVFLHRPEERLRVFVGGDGAFHAEDLPRGPLSLTVVRSGHPTAVTDWFTI